MPPGQPGRENLSFGADRKMRWAWEFERTRVEGKRVVQGCLIFNARVDAALPASRLGVVTSKTIGNAVARSRARRLLREVFRLNQYRLKPPADIVLVARRSIAGKNCSQVEKDFVAAAKQAKLLAVSA